MTDESSAVCQSRTFFWSQKKDNEGNNYVIIDGKKSSEEFLSPKFGKSDAHDIKYDKGFKQGKYKVSVRYYISTHSNTCIFVNGFLNERDSFGRFIGYSFLYISSEKITKNLLNEVKTELYRCVLDIMKSSFTSPEPGEFLEGDEALQLFKDSCMKKLIIRMFTGFSPDGRTVSELAEEMVGSISSSSQQPPPSKM